MINLLVIATLVCSFSVDYLARKLGLISPYFILLPELFSGIALLVVFARILAGKRLLLDARYILFLVLLFFTIAMGAVAQAVPSGAIISGLRDYLRFLPFFLLPAIYPFTGRQIKAQLTVLGVMLIVQVPVAVYQRFFAFADRMHTGDVVTGTMSTSGSLSILMVAGVAGLTVLYLKRRLSLALLLAATGFLLLPTMLNETKATLVMLPIAMLAPLFLMRGAERPFRRLFPLVAVFAATGVVFIGVYNTLMQEHRDSEASLQEFWFEGGVQNYVYKGSVEGDSRVGRLDSLQLAVRGVTQTPLRAAFGLGVGNVSPAQIPGFEGEYAHYYDLYKISFTQASMLLWNMGFMGLVVFGLFYFATFRDALLLARSSGPSAMLGQVWAPITLIAAMCLAYKSTVTMNEIMYPLMFYAGVLARTAYSLRREQRARRHEAARPGVWRPVSAMARQ